MSSRRTMAYTACRAAAVAVALAGIAAHARAAARPSKPPQADRPGPRIIQYTAEVAVFDRLPTHAAALQDAPVDGVLFRLRKHSVAFDPRPWSTNDLIRQGQAMGDIRWGKLSDNFLVLHSANHHGMDWFDDRQWTQIAANIRALAQVASAAGAAGLCLDPEPYGPNPWAFSGNGSGKVSFEQMCSQVRKRGAQFMRAIQEGYPRPRLLTLFLLSQLENIVRTPEGPQRQQKLMLDRYALLPAFVEGMLEAAGEGTVIIDGNENAYYYRSEGRFKASRQMLTRMASLLAPQYRQAYTEHVKLAHAVFLDELLAQRPPEGGHLAYYLRPNERLNWLAQQVYWAGANSDTYVWLYSQETVWGTAPLNEPAVKAVGLAVEHLSRSRRLDLNISESLKQAQQRWDRFVDRMYPVRSARVSALSGPVPDIDGSLRDACWQSETLEAFQPPASTMQRRSKVRTQAWVNWDSRGVNIALWCQRPAGEEGQPLAPTEAVQILISRGERTEPYTHVEIRPATGQVSVRGGGRSQDVRWAHQKSDGYWTAEVRLPWSMLGGAPKIGDKRRANIARTGGAAGVSCWSGVTYNVVEPWRMGYWTFMQ